MPISYCIATKKEQISRFFNAKPVYDYKAQYNAATDDFLPAILGLKPNEIVELKWHFPWPGKQEHPLSHFVPLETILSHWKQPATRRNVLLKAIRIQRCVVIANCFVVWHHQQPYCMYVQDQRMFAFAGIWNETPSHTGFALLMQPPNELLDKLGQKEMPLILHEWQVHYWLNPGTSYSRITGIMKSNYPPHKMNAYPIGPEVNDRGKNSASIYRPTGEKLNPEIDYGVKERLVKQGWGRNKI